MYVPRGKISLLSALERINSLAPHDSYGNVMFFAGYIHPESIAWQELLSALAEKDLKAAIIDNGEEYSIAFMYWRSDSAPEAMDTGLAKWTEEVPYSSGVSRSGHVVLDEAAFNSWLKNFTFLGRWPSAPGATSSSRSVHKEEQRVPGKRPPDAGTYTLREFLEVEAALARERASEGAKGACVTQASLPTEPDAPKSQVSEGASPVALPEPVGARAARKPTGPAPDARNEVVRRMCDDYAGRPEVLAKEKKTFLIAKYGRHHTVVGQALDAALKHLRAATQTPQNTAEPEGQTPQKSTEHRRNPK